MRSYSLEAIKSQYKDGKYREALSLIEEVVQAGLLHPEVLVLKGCCIQLADKEASYELIDAEQAFKQALEIDEEFTPAIIELAWFYLNVLDDAVRAAPLFERAISLHKLMLTEAVIGMVRCLSETETKTAARKYLADISNISLDMNQIQDVMSEIEAL